MAFLSTSSAQPRNAEYLASLEMLKKALGPVVLRLIHDERVTDITIRPGWASATFVGTGRAAVSEVIGSIDVVGALRVIAPMLGRKIGIESPRVRIGIGDLKVRIVGTYEGPYGYASTLSIRCHRVADAKMTDFLGIRQEQIGVLSDRIRDRSERRGILIAGTPGSGKTTFLRALLTLIPQDEHIILVQDIDELDLPQPFVTKHEVTDYYTYRDAMADVRREEPDRVVLQEIIGPEARDVISAGLSGTPPYSTVHAYSIPNALQMIEKRALEGGADNAVGKDEIAGAFGIGIQMRRSKLGFSVASIVNIGYDEGGYSLVAI